MSAAILREAAALMRERAEAANRDAVGDGGKGTLQRARKVAVESHAVHIASWQPNVALAVADWLDAEAVNAAPIQLSTAKAVYGPLMPGSNTPSSVTYSDFTSEVIACDRRALAVARAYLGATP